MDHAEALRLMMVERYLLNELPAPDRDEFETHFFDCQECTADLRTTAAFLDAAKRESQSAAVPQRSPSTKRPTAADKKAWFSFLWTPSFLSPAFALLLLVVIYQNVLVLPRLAADAGSDKNPEILPSLSLVNSRGGAIASLTVSQGQSFLLPVDIPTTEQFSRYSCELVAPSGAMSWSLPVTAEEAKNTVSIRVPAERRLPGVYTLIVRGYPDPHRGSPVEITRYEFTLDNPN